MKRFNPADDQWIRKNFEKLVKNYAGKYVAVASGKVSFGKTRREAEEKISKKVKGVVPSVMQIPYKESLICAL